MMARARKPERDPAADTSGRAGDDGNGLFGADSGLLYLRLGIHRTISIR
jgi:hypothetical protein